VTGEAESVDETRLRAVFRALSEEQVAYAVFGAVALGLHGLARATADLDLFVAASPANIERLKAALHRVGVRRFRTVQEANAERDDPYRREAP